MHERVALGEVGAVVVAVREGQQLVDVELQRLGLLRRIDETTQVPEERREGGLVVGEVVEGPLLAGLVAARHRRGIRQHVGDVTAPELAELVAIRRAVDGGDDRLQRGAVIAQRTGDRWLLGRPRCHGAHRFERQECVLREQLSDRRPQLGSGRGGGIRDRRSQCGVPATRVGRCDVQVEACGAVVNSASECHARGSGRRRSRAGGCRVGCRHGGPHCARNRAR